MKALIAVVGHHSSATTCEVDFTFDVRDLVSSWLGLFVDRRLLGVIVSQSMLAVSCTSLSTFR